MANYGITALSGLSGALDRQDQKNEAKDQRAWRDETRDQKRKQWDRADNEFAAGAENKGLARGNQKLELLIQQGAFEREKLFKDLRPALQVVSMDNGDRNEYGQAMAQILSGVNSKEIEFVPTEDETFQFKSKDGKTYGFDSFDEARNQIGRTLKDPVEFLKTRSEALNEENVYVTPKGEMVRAKRGEAKQKGYRLYDLVRAEGEMSALSRKNAGTYGGTFTDADGTVKVINNRTGKTKKVGNHYTSPADKLDIESKQIKQYVSTVNGLLIPFKGKESGSMPMFDKDGTPTVVAENAYKKAQDYLTETLERNEPLTQRDYNDLKTAQAAINAFEEFKVFITGSGQNSQSRGGGVATGGKLNVGKYKIASPGESGGVSPGAGDGGGQPQQAIGGPVSVNPGAINPSGGMSPDARDLQYQNSPTATPHINPALPKDLKQWNVKELRGADGVYKYYAFVSGQREPMEITPEEYKYWFTNKNPARDQTPYRGGLYSPYKNQ